METGLWHREIHNKSSQKIEMIYGKRFIDAGRAAGFKTYFAARAGAEINFSVPSAFLAQVTPKSIPTPFYGLVNTVRERYTHVFFSLMVNHASTIHSQSS